MMIKEIDQFLAILHDQNKSIGINKVRENVSANIQKKTGKKIGQSTFQNKSNPNIASHKFNIEEFIYVILELKENSSHSRVLNSFLSIFDCRLEQLSKTDKNIDFDYKVLIDKWMDFNKEYGDVQEALKNSLSDYKISTNELHKIKFEIDEQINAMTALEQVLDEICGKKLI